LIMTAIYLDIETLPTDREDVISELRGAVKPPATYKKSESIEAWMKENIDAETDAAVSKTALDGSFGRVCCIGVAIEDGEVNTFTGNEREILTSYTNHLADHLRGEEFTTTVIGHNVLSFDLRFLMQRHMVNGIRPSIVIERAARAKPWDMQVFDTMTQWAGVGNRISLHKLCMALGVKSPKGDMDGSQVYDYWKAGRIEEIAAYCSKDVEAVRNVFTRMAYA